MLQDFYCRCCCCEFCCFCCNESNRATVVTFASLLLDRGLVSVVFQKKQKEERKSEPFFFISCTSLHLLQDITLTRLGCIALFQKTHPLRRANSAGACLQFPALFRSHYLTFLPRHNAEIRAHLRYDRFRRVHAADVLVIWNPRQPGNVNRSKSGTGSIPTRENLDSSHLSTDWRAV